MKLVVKGILTMLIFFTDRFQQVVQVYLLLIHMSFLTDRFNKWYRYTYC